MEYIRMATQPKPSAAPVAVPAPQPNPANIFEAINSFQLTFAMRTAIELEVFTAIAEGADTAAAIALRCNAAERGIRILCDYLAINGFLHKNGSEYSTTIDTGIFLNKRSPAYMGGTIEFLLSPEAFARFGDMTNAVRNGGTTGVEKNTTVAENPMWEKFAHGMTGMIAPIAQGTAKSIDLPTDREIKVLDIAASHGMFGFAVAQHYPKAHVVALDWQNVLRITAENAQKFGFADRFSTITGDAFAVDFGQNYDLILLPNILHHFSAAKNTELLAKCLGSLNPSGTVAIVEFVPNDDRVSPPMPAAFSLTMLCGTPEGDAYTYAEFRDMLHNAGFSEVEKHSLSPLPHDVVIGRK
jgi:ubiquinone/menaquinone biosynthesis C-methylase UbiE